MDIESINKSIESENNHHKQIINNLNNNKNNENERHQRHLDFLKSQKKRISQQKQIKENTNLLELRTLNKILEEYLSY